MINDFISRHRYLLIIVPVVIMLLLGALLAYINSSTTGGVVEENCNEEGSVCYEKRMGIKASLPYSNPLYSITYNTNSSNDTIINIDAYEGYRNAAVNKLYEFGFNPTDYIINFNYKNPFDQYE